MKKFLIALLLLILASNFAEARRGCCSHHGGVAGCDKSSGRQICADGTLSKSCYCENIYKKTNLSFLYIRLNVVNPGF